MWLQKGETVRRGFPPVPKTMLAACCLLAMRSLDQKLITIEGCHISLLVDLDWG